MPGFPHGKSKEQQVKEVPLSFLTLPSWSPQPDFLVKQAWFLLVIIGTPFSWPTTPFFGYSTHPKASSYHTNQMWSLFIFPFPPQQKSWSILVNSVGWSEMWSLWILGEEQSWMRLPWFNALKKGRLPALASMCLLRSRWTRIIPSRSWTTRF